MSKRNKTQTAGAVCKGGIASTVGGAVDAINEAAKELGDLPRSQDYGRIVAIARIVADSMEVGLGKVCAETDGERLADAFVHAVGLLHKAVCRRDGEQLRMSIREVGFYIPFTQRLDLRGEWDLNDRSWESPKFRRLRGFAAIEGREPPRRGSSNEVRVRRYAKAWLSAMMDETKALSRMSRRRAVYALPCILREATVGYEKFRDCSRFGAVDVMAAPQFVLAYLRTLESIINVAMSLGSRELDEPSRSFSATVHFDDLFWFVMPELPAADNPLGGSDFADECVGELAWRIRGFSSLAPDLFVGWSYQAVCCLEACIRESLKMAFSRTDDFLFALSDVLEGLRDSLERSDAEDYRPRRQTIQPELLDPVSSDETASYLRRVTHCALRVKDKKVIHSMPTRLRECMWMFTRAANSDEADMEALVRSLDDSLNQMVIRVNHLCSGAVR